MTDTLLTLKNFVKTHDDIFKLNIPDLEFKSGRIYSLVGSNGAGKTSLLKLLCLLDKPTEGELFFLNQKVTNSNVSVLRRKISMVMENPFLFHRTVFNNIAIGLRCYSIEKKKWPRKVREALIQVGLEGFESRQGHNLSRGEIQRVAIARILALNPEVILLDEPFTNIDKKNTLLIEGLIREVNRVHGTTVIFTTHDLLQAYRLSSEIISLVKGKIIEGSSENIFEASIDEVNGGQFAKISPNISVSVVTTEKGKVHISIPPQDIILSHDRILSSARNVFSGRVKIIQMERDIARVSVFIDEGIEFVALITKRSYKDMELFVDAEVFVTFKSTAVKVF